MTVEQQLRKLPSPYDEMAIKETIKQRGKYYLKYDEKEYLYRVLITSITWDDSEMGFDFWVGIYNNAQYHKL